MNTLIDTSKLTKLQEDYQKELARVSDSMANELGKCFKELCKKVPIIKKFGWSQYTPYFNDGEPCEFGANSCTIAFSDDVNNNDLAYDDDITDDGSIKKLSFMPSEDDLVKDYPNWRWRKELCNAILKDLTLEQRDAIRDFFSIMESLGEDLLKATFGDHALIIYYSDGWHEVEEYEHD